MTNQEGYNELALYTLSLRDPEFIHQYVVDAYCAQNADVTTKPIALTFALVGLYLHIEKGYSGRKVQLAHMEMGKNKRKWPVFEIPEDCGDITVHDVLQAKEGSDRDTMIVNWSASVWSAWSGSKKMILDLANSELHLQ